MLHTKQNLLRRVILRSASEICKLAKPVDSFVTSRHNIAERLAPPPLFIIGAPRTGSTLVYQIITNHFDVNYISNFSASFYHSLYVGMVLADFIFGSHPHNSFKSRYGMTGGLKGPHECGQFWYRWFPKDRHFIASHEFSAEELIGIRKTIGAIGKRIPKPIVFKNLNNGQRLQVIQKILPEALFVFVKRNSMSTAQSILASREAFCGDRNTWFSVMPKNKKELETMDYPEQIVKQIYYLEKQIEKDLKRFPPSQSILVEYEKFCEETNEELERLYQFFRSNNVSVEKRKNAVVPRLRVDNETPISEEDFRLIQKEVQKISW